MKKYLPKRKPDFYIPLASISAKEKWRVKAWREKDNYFVFVLDLLDGRQIICDQAGISEAFFTERPHVVEDAFVTALLKVYAVMETGV